MGEVFVKTLYVDDHHPYRVTKIVNYLGQVYYKATPIGRGVTRCAETQQLLESIVKKDITPPQNEPKKQVVQQTKQKFR